MKMPIAMISNLVVTFADITPEWIGNLLTDPFESLNLSSKAIEVARASDESTEGEVKLDLGGLYFDSDKHGIQSMTLL